MSKRQKLVIAIVLWSFLLLLFGAPFLLHLPSVIRERTQRLPFERSLWTSERGLTNAMRIRMVDDLLGKHQFRGMPSNQVVSIIGPSDRTGYFRDYDLVYWLGPERSFIGIDSEWLVLKFDSVGEVSECRIVTD